MIAINFCRKWGVTYVHSPFVNIGHAEMPMQEWADRWEAFFNLGFGEELFDGDDQNVVNFTWNVKDIVALFARGQMKELALTESCISELKRKYRQNKTQSKRNKNDAVLNVGIHIRRGDVAAEDPQRWTETTSVAKTLSRVLSTLDKNRLEYTIRVFSEGEVRDFRSLNLSDDKFYLNRCALWTMGELIDSDILILAKSSFSHVAGILSDGIKIAEPFYYYVNDWITSNARGEFDSDLFVSRLDEYLALRARP